MDWLGLLAVQDTLKSLLQHHSSKASILWCSAFFIVQLSHPYMTTGKTIALTKWTFVGRVMPLFFIYLFIFNFILFLNFKILYWFCQISKWIRNRYTCVPRPEPSSLLPPHTIPLGHPSAPAPSIQYCALNLDWRLVPYMILYVFKCHSPKSLQMVSAAMKLKDAYSLEEKLWAT